MSQSPDEPILPFMLAADSRITSDRLIEEEFCTRYMSFSTFTELSICVLICRLASSCMLMGHEPYICIHICDDLDYFFIRLRVSAF